MNAFILACGAAMCAAAPLVAEPARVDLGVIKAGPTVSQAFPLANRGSKPLTITGATASCGCMTPRVTQTSLAPGESAQLLVEIRTLTQPAGPNRWTVRVAYRTDNDDLNVVPLELTAQLVREVTVEPATLAIYSDRAGTHEIVVIDRRSAPLQITSVVTGLAWLTAERRQVSTNEQGQRSPVVLTISEALPPGQYETELIVRTSDPEYAELRVPVRVTRRSAGAGLLAAPDRVSLRSSATDPMPARLVQLRDRGGKPIEIVTAETDIPGVRCRWAIGSHRIATVRIETTQPPRANSQGTVTITGRTDTEVKLQLPLSVTGPSE